MDKFPQFLKKVMLLTGANDANALKALIANNPEFIGYLWESEVDASVKVLFTINSP